MNTGVMKAKTRQSLYFQFNPFAKSRGKVVSHFGILDPGFQKLLLEVLLLRPSLYEELFNSTMLCNIKALALY